MSTYLYESGTAISAPSGKKVKSKKDKSFSHETGRAIAHVPASRILDLGATKRASVILRVNVVLQEKRLKNLAWNNKSILQKSDTSSD